jgi:hypothetical protein
MTTRNVLAAGLIISFLYACNKTDNVAPCITDYGNPSAAEVTNVQNYLAMKGITADEDSSGFFYHITFTGTGSESPTLADSVTVKYRGSLSDGSVFDSTASGITRKFPLSRLITGWQEGLPLIKKGGVIDLCHHLMDMDAMGKGLFLPMPSQYSMLN